MSEFNPQSQVYSQDVAGLKAYVTKVFVNMAIALGITAAVAYLCYSSYSTGGFVYQLLSQFPYLMFVMIIVEFGVVIAFSAGITRFSTVTVRTLMFVYAAVTGITFSFLPLAYNSSTVFQAFAFAAVLFVCCAVIGAYTKIDLTKFSGIFTGALLAFVIMTAVSWFIPVLRDSMFMGYLGLLLFMGLTAWDMQKIKAYYYQLGEGTIKSNMAIYSAFQMYLDFINVFLFILRILGNGRSRD